ncbi:putative DsbA family dithiol-disulfide isomerase [Bacillus pakistanensis]|uniref:DsbA family dithiol-disulfide isomerase n=1 Tax=Rossellomorea pakistanensis TaxID=992288 RepID=A0ABS2N840_9BACI|nr:DsbA family oxidoreductase [Bacillus pakistanensis]MBM7584028.1 putative DsbA family dithiol-disulfide isomerase [Bacillus pakistanensis]
MKIEVWSDYACPFCYIGKRRLEEALETFPHKSKVEVVFKSFELDPNSDRNTDRSIHEIIANKYGTSIDQAKKMNENLRKQALSVGLDFKFDSMIPTNTLDAHRLTKFAETKGKVVEITERLLKAYFTDSLHIGDHRTLLHLAEEVGLDRDEVESILKSEDFTKEVRNDESQASQIGVTGVPFFVINQKYSISGAQPKEVFESAILKVWEEENNKPILQSINPDSNEGMICSDDGCEIPTNE